MQDIHVVDGDSAQGGLRYAVQRYGLRGDVFALNDWLSLGPLDNPRARIDFMRTTYLPPVGFLDPDFIVETDTVFARWSDLQARCQIPSRVIIWTSGSGSDHVLLRMACHFLQNTGAMVWQVVVPPDERGYEAVGAHNADALARFAQAMAPLPRERVSALAQEFAVIASHPEPLRECDANGVLHYRPLDWHDALVLRSCPRHWTRVGWVVGQSMGACDPRNAMSDMFFATRVRALIDAGKMESRTPMPYLFWIWNLEVRRVTD